MKLGVLSLLPERLGHLATRAAGLALGEILHAVRSEASGLAVERLEGNFERHCRRHREISALVEDKLRPTQCHGIFRSDDRDQRFDFLVEIGRLADSIDQIISLRGLRIEQLTDQIPFLGLAAASKFLQPRHAAPAWRDIPVDLWHTPTASIGRDHEIAGQGELEATSRANPVNSRDRDAREIFDRLRRFLILTALPVRIFVIPGQKVLDVVTSTERISGPLEHEKPAFPILLYSANGVRKFFRHLAIESVVDLRSVEGDPSDRSFALEDDVLVL